jgi:hypothetical protein
MDLAGAVPIVVLVEGRSDVAALTALIRSSGGAGQVPVDLVDMGGVTNIRRELRRHLASGRAGRILGLCDEREVAVFVAALRERCPEISSKADLPAFGFQICRADLEHELIRMTGTDGVLDVIAAQELGDRFERFRGQPAWRGRPLTVQLHRFAGTTAGRKAALAGALARHAPWPPPPGPLRALVEQIGQAVHEFATSPLHRFEDC